MHVGIHIILFTTLPLGCPHINISCLIKTLLGKTLWEKKHSEEKRVQLYPDGVEHADVASLKP